MDGTIRSRTDVGFQGIKQGSQRITVWPKGLQIKTRTLFFRSRHLGKTVRFQTGSGFQVRKHGGEKKAVGPKGFSSRPEPQHSGADTWTKYFCKLRNPPPCNKTGGRKKELSGRKAWRQNPNLIIQEPTLGQNDSLKDRCRLLSHNKGPNKKLPSRWGKNALRGTSLADPLFGRKNRSKPVPALMPKSRGAEKNGFGPISSGTVFWGVSGGALFDRKIPFKTRTGFEGQRPGGRKKRFWPDQLWNRFFGGLRGPKDGKKGPFGPPPFLINSPIGWSPNKYLSICYKYLWVYKYLSRAHKYLSFIQRKRMGSEKF